MGEESPSKKTSSAGQKTSIHTNASKKASQIESGKKTTNSIQKTRIEQIQKSDKTQDWDSWEEREVSGSRTKKIETAKTTNNADTRSDPKVWQTENYINKHNKIKKKRRCRWEKQQLRLRPLSTPWLEFLLWKELAILIPQGAGVWELPVFRHKAF